MITSARAFVDIAEVGVDAVEFYPMQPVALDINDGKGGKVSFLSFAKAFTKAWQSAYPEEMADDKGYIKIVDSGLNGGWTDEWKNRNEAYECILDKENGYLYMKSGADHGIDYQFSYWKRTDGKYLLGVNRLVWQVTDKVQADSSQLAFYLYDPIKGNCLYDSSSVDAVLTSINDVIKKYGKAGYDKNSQTSTYHNLLLPREGKNIVIGTKIISLVGPRGTQMKHERPKIINHDSVIKWNDLSFDALAEKDTPISGLLERIDKGASPKNIIEQSESGKHY